MSVNRRASLPGASELFRPTQSPATPSREPVKPQPASRPTASGRVKHDQKITVYFSSEELFALEDATLELKRRYGINLDRGRLVRTAVALAIHDLTERGAESAVIAELTGA